MIKSDSFSASGSYEVDLRSHILQRLRSANITDQVFVVIQVAYQKAQEVENIILSSPERERLLADVLKSVLAEPNKNLTSAEYLP